MNHGFSQLLVRWAIMALGVTIATKIIPSIVCDNGTTLIVFVLLLSFFNAILRPLLLVFTLPFILVTMGLGILVINALLFYAVGHLVDGFKVPTFWSALGGSLVVSATSLLLGRFTRAPRTSARSRGPVAPPSGSSPKAPRAAKRGDDVIDI